MNQDLNTLAAKNPTVVALRGKTQSLLEPRLKLVFEEMAEHLFNLSASAQLNAENRSRSFEAFSLLRAQHKSLIKTLLARIDRGYDKLVAVSSDEVNTLPTELDLVDLSEFESNLAIDRMVKLGNERYWLPLEAITLRLATAIDADPKSIQLPFGLKVCFSGYRSVLAPLEFNDEILTELDKAFARNLLPELREVYQQINTLLADDGLLPNIEQVLESSGSKLNGNSEDAGAKKSGPGPHNPQAETDLVDSPQPSTQAQVSNRPYTGQPQRVYQQPSQQASQYASAQGMQQPVERSGPSISEGTGTHHQRPVAQTDGQPPHPASATHTSDTLGNAPFLSDFPSASPTQGELATAGEFPSEIITGQNLTDSGLQNNSPGYMQGAPSGLQPQTTTYSAVDNSAPLLSPLDKEAQQLGFRNYLPQRTEHRPSATVGSGLLNRLRSNTDFTDGHPGSQTAEQASAQSQELVDRLISMRQSGVRWSTDAGKLVDKLGLVTEGPDAAPNANSVALVDQLFSTLSDVVPANPPVVNSLYSLKLPLAQLALTEPDFYRNREHPARLLIERLTELAALTPKGNARMESKLNEILDQLNVSYDGTHDAFDKALNKVTELALGALRQQQRSIQRQVAAEDGREKHRSARDEVARSLSKSMPQSELPKILVSLLETVLHDALTLRVLRSGKDVYYLDVLAALGQINSALLEENGATFTDTQQSLDVIKGCLVESELLDANSEKLLRDIEIAVGGGGTIERVASPYRHTDIYLEPDFSERIASLPRLSRWVKRARELPINTWLSSVDETGMRINRQLVWRNDAGTRFTLTNEQGQGVEQLDLLTLARRLATKLQPLNASEQLSIIERSVFSSLEEKQADLLSISQKKTSSTLSRPELVDKVQSMLRRARRRGASHVAAAVVAHEEPALAKVVDALNHAGLAVETYGRLSDHLAGLIIDSSSTGTVQNALNTLTLEEPLSKHGVVLIDPSFKDGESVWQGLEDYLEGAFDNSEIIVEQHAHQKDLAAAVVKTYSYLCDEMPPRFSLREMIRRRANELDSSQQMFQVLLDGTADAGAEVTRQTGYHSTALAIALDCAKIAAVTQLAEQLANSDREVPIFSICIATDAALHHDFLEFVLKAISDSGIGTDRLCIELNDSMRLREASRVADFARTLRSIGCQICISGVHPNRGSTAQLQALSPHMLILDASLWPPEEGSHLASLNQAISDLHHLVGEHVVLRDERDPAKAAELGIDLIESSSTPEIDPQQLIDTLPALAR